MSNSKKPFRLILRTLKVRKRSLFHRNRKKLNPMMRRRKKR